MHKSLAELVDELSIVNVKIFHVQNWVHEVAKGRRVTGPEAEEKIKQLTALNMRRSALKNAISQDGEVKI